MMMQYKNKQTNNKNFHHFRLWMCNTVERETVSNQLFYYEKSMLLIILKLSYNIFSRTHFEV